MSERSLYQVKECGESRTFTLTAKSQTAKVLNHLIANGEHGVTAQEVSSWLLRMSEYIRRLRADYGLHIVTVKEEHTDPWGKQGWHGRYILKDAVRMACNEVEGI
ncbi:winged helix domain-containing protein [Kordiimonas sp.]|uniref:winged helix domain-containing protein n=1 Tax=Kordiimonas sp. TaxID=1970157 RepID=UPI003B52A108